MHRTLSLLIFILISVFANIAFAQKPKDTLIFNLPVVNGKLTYQGSRTINGKQKTALDTVAKSWLASYFKTNELSTASQSNNDTSVFLLKEGIIDYKVKPGMVNINFIARLRVKVTCKDNFYSFTIDSIRFRPKNSALNEIGYENDPDYLISIYKRKHLGLSTAWEVSRGQIREYLAKINGVVRNCIASLNKAMTN